METSSAQSKVWDPNFPLRPSKLPIFYGWVVVVITTLGICSSMPGQTIGVGVFTARLSIALELSMMQLSVAYMLGTLASAVGLNAGGRLFDRIGGRKVLVGSIVALGFVLIGLSFVEWFAGLIGNLPGMSKLPWLAPFSVLVVGFALLRFTGQGMVTLASRGILGKWFDRKRGTVTAWSGAAVAMAFSLAPLGFEHLISEFGWQGAWRVMGFFCIGVLSLVYWFFARDNPEECQLEMDGGTVKVTQKENPDSKIYRDYTLVDARRTLAFWAFTLMFGLNGLVVTAYMFHVIAIGAEMGVSTDFILGLFLPSAVVSVVTGAVVAWLSDQSFVRIKYLLAIMALASSMGFGVTAFGSYPEMSWIHVLGFGMMSGCFGSLSSIIYPRFFGRQHLGAISGLFMTVIVVASAVGPFLFSLAEVLFGQIRNGFSIALCVSLLVFVVSFWADNPQRKKTGLSESA